MIEPGDKISITVYNHPDLSSVLNVDSSGDVRVPVAGTVPVSGLSEESAAAKIESAFSPYLFHPSVDVRLAAQGQSIFFTGSLIGVQPFSPGETLGAAIGAFRQTLTPQNAGTSGPVSINSIDLHRVRVKRGTSLSSEVNMDDLNRSGEPGPTLQPGDVVLLRAKPVRVDVRGDISNPTTVYVYPGDTLAQAVAEAGRFTSSTSLAQIGLRRNGEELVVSSASPAFTQAAHDGDVVVLQPAPRVSVLGMVEKGGDQTLQTRPTLLSALYEAGGPNRFADLAHVQVAHEGVTKVYDISSLAHGNITQNIPVEDGDTIFVPEGHKIDLSSFGTVVNALSSFAFATHL